MKIIAKRGKSSFLVLTDEEKLQARVWNDKEKEWEGNAFFAHSILARGYWADFEGTLENGEVREGAPQ